MDFLLRKCTLIDVNSIKSDRFFFFFFALLYLAFQMNGINNSAKSLIRLYNSCVNIYWIWQTVAVTSFDLRIVTTLKLNVKWKIGALIFRRFIALQYARSIYILKKYKKKNNLGAKYTRHISFPRLFNANELIICIRCQSANQLYVD